MMKQREQEILNVLKSRFDEREAQNILRNMSEYLPEMEEDEFQTTLIKLQNGEPWQYVVGEAWFYGLELKVNSSVLIPRAETEELVHLILQENEASSLKLLDIGTGSGCIPLALKFNRAHWEISAYDVDEAALAIANSNAKRMGLHVSFELVDILNEVPTEKEWDIMVSNPPYIPHKEAVLMNDLVLQHEPHLALFVSDEDPLIFYRIISEYAFVSLKSGGILYFELNEFLAHETQKLVEEKGFNQVSIIQDLSGKNRMLRAVK